MREVPLSFPLALATFFFLFGTIPFPGVKLIAFAPFLALIYQRSTLQRALWIAALCGFAIDVLSSEFRLGIYSVNYALTTLCLYNQKKHFVEDKPVALSLFTLMISVTSTLIEFLLIAIFDKALPLCTQWIFTDLIAMPIADSLYAFVWFSAPMILYAHIKKVGWHVFYTQLKKQLVVRFKDS